MTSDTKAPEEKKPAESSAVASESPAAAPESPAVAPKSPIIAPESPAVAPEEPVIVVAPPKPVEEAEPKEEVPKTELPPEFKTVHSSPPPRDTPLVQEDDAPKDRAAAEELIDQALTFLETGSVPNAPAQDKQRFLQSKGLSATEAQQLIGKIDRKKRRKGKGKSVAVPPEMQKPSTPAPQPVLQMQPTPTILTYPEWLAPPPPPGPRPLMTGASLATSVYLGAATAATVYAANKLVVTPMLDALTMARLDFTATVKKNLDELNTRLLELAPASYVAGKGLVRVRDEDEMSEACSDISDPSELFHVDAQTQTDPSLAGHGNDDEMGTGAMTPDSKLEELTLQMKVLVETHSDATDNELTFLLEDLTSYLENLSYESTTMYPHFGTGFGDKDKDDPILKVKQEIRSVKGVLLNTKNFPAGR